MPAFVPESDSEDELPPAWEERVTQDNFVFYVNHLTKSTQWTHPRTGKMKKVVGDLPFGWKKKVEEGTGKIIFYDQNNKQTYTDPRLAFAVEESNNAGEIRQKFDASSTALQVLHGKDLSNKVALITGANTGIGFETARSLAFHGCEIIFACRNENSALDAIDKIKKEKPNRKCSFFKLDLCSLKSTKNFTDEVKSSYKHIDYLILNAAVFALPHSVTEDKLETIFQVCHLSHFYLTLQLSDLLDHNSRVVVVSSESHRFSNLPSDNLDEHTLSPPSSKFRSMMAYNNVKLCNVLFARELSKRWVSRGISVFCLHPGNMVSSNLSRNWWFYRFLFALVRPFTKSLQQAAATTVYCAIAPELTGVTGFYFNNCYICEPSQLAQNDELATHLWEVSSAMVEKILNSYKDFEI